MLAQLMHLSTVSFLSHQIAVKFDFYSRSDWYRKPIRGSHKVMMSI